MEGAVDEYPAVERGERACVCVVVRRLCVVCGEGKEANISVRIDV